MFGKTSNRSVMQHDFSRVPQANIQRSAFRRSHGHKTAFDGGYLIPIYVDEALPGDTFRLSLTSICRLQTLLVPIMDNLHLDFFFFSVPNRLVWENWQRFMGERDPDPDSSTDYTVPQVTVPGGGFAEASLFDYFGIPIGYAGIQAPNALHSRAYNLIWNEWFRDQNLQDSVTVDKDDGPDTDTDYVLLKRGKRHDYFTSCLPNPQVGDAVDLPLGDSAPVVGDGYATVFYDAANLVGLNSGATYKLRADTGFVDVLVGSSPASGTSADNVAIGVHPNPANPSHMVADLSSATAATINSLREAFQLQRMLERDARSGTRYIEVVKSHFGVTSPDLRATRPEYLGGGSTRINVSPVAQTSESGSTAQGYLTAVGFGQQSGVGFSKSFTEHCVIIGLCSVRADLTYQTGLNRMWTRQTRYDYYWPALAHLGEQEVLNQEIYADGSANDDDVFGYQERYAEYRYFPSKITGVLRSAAATSLDVWHLSQDFGSLPVLGSTFIQESPPIDRVVAVTDEPEFIFDGYFDIVCTRPMPMYSVPGLIDHF